MVQIQVSEVTKPTPASDPASLTRVTSTNPREVPEPRPVRLSERRERSSRCYWLSAILYLIIGLCFMATVKRLCDYKEENFRLMQELAVERQKVYVLKGKVRDNIPEATFVVQPELPQVGYDLQIAGAEHGWFTVNLRVLWNSPHISVCDAVSLLRILARDIYHQHQKLEMIEN